MFKNKIALITGASRGIGRALAIEFARNNAHVILIARSEKELITLSDEITAKSGKATIIPLDLSEPKKIENLAYTIMDRYKKLDILIGNAATAFGCMHLVDHTINEWNEIIAVNLTSNWRLIRALHPLISLSEAGRIIMVTSSVAKTNAKFWGCYAISKCALEKMVHIYAEETRRTKIKINLINPGAVKTKIRKTFMPGEEESKLKKPESITKLFLQLSHHSCKTSGEIYYC